MPFNTRYSSLRKTGTREQEEDSYQIDSKDDMVISYMMLRRLLGVLGIALPFALVIFSLINRNECYVLPSISDYYHSSVRTIFVCIISAMSIFLFAYNVADKRETILARIAAVMALGIIFAPTSQIENVIHPNDPIDTSIFNQCYTPTLFSKSNELVGWIHYSSAAIFFSLLAVLVYFFFRPHEKSMPEPSKARIILYNLCAGGMLASMILIAVFNFLLPGTFEHATFTFETTSLIFFGIAWLVRGDVTLEGVMDFRGERDE